MGDLNTAVGKYRKGLHQGIFKPKFPEKYLGDVRNIQYRSGWEFKFFRYCDQTPGIVKWASEEFHVPYISPVDGQGHRYFPDIYMQVRTADGKLAHHVFEIKPKKETLPPVLPKRKTARYLTEIATFAVNQAKWDAARRYCQARGWTFQVLTEDHLFEHAR
jgi:hypothetical protein